jgi:hypothetical protein
MSGRKYCAKGAGRMSVPASREPAAASGSSFKLVGARGLSARKAEGKPATDSRMIGQFSNQMARKAGIGECRVFHRRFRRRF